MTLLLLAIVLCGYYGVYLASPHDLEFHLQTSNRRPFVQLWPSALFVLFSSLAPLSLGRNDSLPQRSTRSVPSGILRRLASVGPGERAFVIDMDLRTVLLEIHTALDEQGVDHVLIGGLALAAHGAARATIDVDFLADGLRDGDVDAVMRAHGYECLHRTENVGNYLSRDRARGRVDFLFARRRYAREMLARAAIHTVLGQQLRVADAADLIGLKVQASSSDPRRRGRDTVDIERLLASPGVDLERVRAYFRVFERESELDALLAGEPKR